MINFLLSATLIICLCSCSSQMAEVPTHDPSYLSEREYSLMARQYTQAQYASVPKEHGIQISNSYYFPRTKVKRNVWGRITSPNLYYSYSYLNPTFENPSDAFSARSMGHVSLTLDKQGKVIESTHAPPEQPHTLLPEGSKISRRP